jgi:hypothetical protein
MRREMYGDSPALVAARHVRERQVHRRRFTLVVFVLALMIVITASATRSCDNEVVAAAAPAESTGAGLDPPARLASATYTAQLKSTTAGSGASPVAVLTLDYDAETDTLSYTLEVTTELAGPSVAAVCRGFPDAKGTTVITLFPGPTLAGPFFGVLAEGTITDDDLVGPLGDGTVADLIDLIDDGRAYATIGTADIPIDAVRGQISTVPTAVPVTPTDEPATGQT